MRRRIDGSIVVITGASAGIGRALAAALHARRARLVLSARRIELLDQLNASLGGVHLTVRADVGRSADCQALIRQSIERFGRIDTLVCNAGYGLLRRVAEMTPQEMEQIFRTNVFGTTGCIRFAVPHLTKQDPRDGHRAQIMIVSSAAARRGLPCFGAYAATKAAQLSLAQALRVELNPSNIAVTTVHPMQTETDFFTVSEQLSGSRLPPPGKLARRQSAEDVALAMVRAIERPTPELWPRRGSRWLLNLAAPCFPASPTASWIVSAGRSMSPCAEGSAVRATGNSKAPSALKQRLVPPPRLRPRTSLRQRRFSRR